jgi:hypothetical protein
MIDQKKQFGRGRWPLLLAALAVPLAGCGDLLTVEDPDVARPETVATEEAVPTVLAGAIGDFAVAYGGSPSPGFEGSTPEGQILISGLLADEYIASGSFPTRVEVDQRRITTDNATMQGAFRSLQRARVSAERSVNAFAQFQPNVAGQALALSLLGYTTIFFGENYCSGVPLSRPGAGSGFDFGPPQTTEQLFNQAVARFNEALQIAGGARSTEQQRLARVGLARALLDLNRPQDAAAAVAGVPTNFVFLIEFSNNTARQRNGVHNLVNIAKRWSVANNEGGNGLPFITTNDPRVPVRRTGIGFDQSTPHFSQFKYPDRDSDIPLATGIEARLIEAEAALRRGDIGTFLARINETRTAQGLTAVTDPGAAGRVDLLFRERAFSLWQTSHRLGDLRRLIRQYGRNAEQVFPTGQFFKGGTYGPDVNFPIFIDELNNPAFRDAGGQCINRNA